MSFSICHFSFGGFNLKGNTESGDANVCLVIDESACDSRLNQTSDLNLSDIRNPKQLTINLHAS